MSDIVERLRELARIAEAAAFEASERGLSADLHRAKQASATHHEAADAITTLRAELEALRGKLAGVDEKALEAGAQALHARYEAATHWVRTLKKEPRPFEASGIKEVHRAEARAAIAAYLAAVRDKG